MAEQESQLRMPNLTRSNEDASSDLDWCVVDEQDAAAGYRHCPKLMKTPSGPAAALVAADAALVAVAAAAFVVVAVAAFVVVVVVVAASAFVSWGLSPGPALVPDQRGVQPVAQAAVAPAAGLRNPLRRELLSADRVVLPLDEVFHGFPDCLLSKNTGNLPEFCCFLLGGLGLL